jgi:hypothetical protein
MDRTSWTAAEEAAKYTRWMDRAEGARGLISARARPAIFPMLLLPPLSLPTDPSAPYLGAIVALWMGYLIARMWMKREDRVVSAVWLALTLYSVSAWVSFTVFRENYFPFPSEGVIERGTILSLQCAIAAYVVLRLFVDTSEWDQRVRTSARRLGERVRDLPGGLFVLPMTLLLALGAIDALRLAGIGISTVLSSDRRAFADQLLSTGNHNAQLIAIVTSVIVGCYVVVGKSHARRMFGLFILGLFWIPFLLIGSRKEILIVAIGVYFASVGNVPKFRKRVLTFLAVITALALFLVPVLRGKNVVYSFHEFILPQYMLFTVNTTGFTGVFGQDFVDRSLLLVPEAVRPKKVRDLGTSFANLQLTTTGVGSNPIAEAVLWGALPPIVAFTLVTLLLFLAIGRLSRYHPAVAVLGVPFLFLWGRSEFWVTVFFILYGVLGLRILLGRMKKPDERPAEAEPALQLQEATSYSFSG